jgi:hypothetical protein
MNQNIEVINPQLWAVKFSFFPFISEIEYTPDSEVPPGEESGCITNDGLIILNKDHPGYDLLKDLFPKLMMKTSRQLKKQLKTAKLMKSKSIYENLYATMLVVEAERRNKQQGKKVKEWQQ